MTTTNHHVMADPMERLPEYVRDHRLGYLAESTNDPEYAGDQQLALPGDEMDPEVMTSWTGDRTPIPETTPMNWSALASLPETFHRPVLDIDFPVHVIPSTTPGHGHLYMDKVLTWSQYVEVLEVLGRVGILEPGYVQASIAREFTSVRLPWVKKPATTEMEL